MLFFFFEMHFQSKKESDTRRRAWMKHVFMHRHINRQPQRQPGVWTDGGTKLQLGVHRLRRYWASSVWGGVASRHLTRGRFDKLLHLSCGALTTRHTHTHTRSLSPTRGLVCLRVVGNYTFFKLFSTAGYFPCMITYLWHFIKKQDRILSKIYG